MSDQTPRAGLPLVLLAGDHPDDTNWLRNLLEPAGYAVLREPSGRYALERARGTEPDVIIDASGGYRMYFGGYSQSQQFNGYNFGVATSTDGLHFTPNAVPVLKMPAMPPKTQINSPSTQTAPVRKACWTR